GVFAGLRPLLAGESDETSKLSREHVVAHTVPGLVVVAGGKWTTYRVMAKDAIDEASAALDGKVPTSTTEDIALLGAEGYQAAWRADGGGEGGWRRCGSGTTRGAAAAPPARSASSARPPTWSTPAARPGGREGPDPLGRQVRPGVSGCGTPADDGRGRAALLH